MRSPESIVVTLPLTSKSMFLVKGLSVTRVVSYSTEYSMFQVAGILEVSSSTLRETQRLQGTEVQGTVISR